MRFFIILGLIKGLVLSAEAEGRLRLAPVAETLITMDIMDSRISSVFKFPCNTAHPGACSFIVLHCTCIPRNRSTQRTNGQTISCSGAEHHRARLHITLHVR